MRFVREAGNLRSVMPDEEKDRKDGGYTLAEYDEGQFEEEEWAGKNYFRLQKEAGAPYIAIKDRKVVVSGDSPDQLMEKLDRAYGEPKFIKECPLVTETVDLLNLVYDGFMILLPRSRWNADQSDLPALQPSPLNPAKFPDQVKDDILETFEDLSLAVVRGLRHLGLENALLENGNCILVNGRKLSGLAGCIRWGAFFCHGSILISPDIHRLTEVLLSTQYSEERWVRSMPRAITTISHELGRTVSLPDVKMALRRGFEDAFGIEIVDGSLSAQESYVAKRLLHHKYGTQKWNNNLLDM